MSHWRRRRRGEGGRAKVAEKVFIPENAAGGRVTFPSSSLGRGDDGCGEADGTFDACCASLEPHSAPVVGDNWTENLSMKAPLEHGLLCVKYKHA